MACKFIVNGQESSLYNTILEAYNGDEELAVTLHSYFKNDKDFITNFGNWIEDYGVDPMLQSAKYDYKPGQSRIEENGEPKLYKNEKNGNYYYIDKDKNKVEIIENTKSLKGLFSNEQIERITKVLVNDYFKNNLKIDFENIDLNIKSISIRESVINKLNERINTFKASGDYLFEDTAELLEIALDENLDEIVNNVVNSLETYKIKYSEDFNNNDEDTDLAEIQINENEKDPSFGIASNERTTKNNTSANVKLRLSLIEDTTAEDEFLNDVVYKSFDEIYASLLPQLTDQIAIVKDNVQEDVFEIFKAEILKFENKKPYFKELYRILSQPDLSNEIKNEFSQAFNLDTNNYNTTINKYNEDGGKEVTNINISETGKKESDVFNEWNKNFKDKFVNETKDGITISKENKDRLNIIKSDLNKIKYNQLDSVQNIINILRKLGVENTTKGFQHFLDDFKLINNDNELSEEKFNKAINDINYFIKNIVDNKNTNYDNVLSDQAIFKQLARGEAFYISEGSDASVFTAGKQKWVYSYPSYLSNTIKSWKKDRNILLQHYETSKYNEGSDWMKYLLALGDTYRVIDFLPPPVQEQERIKESQRRINELELFSFNTYQTDENSREGKDNKTISKQEYISDTINKILGFTKGAQSFYRTTTPADKGTQYELAIGRNISTNARYGNGNRDIVVNDEAIDIIFNYFDSEYKRMKFEREFMNDPKNADKLRVYYHTDTKGNIGIHEDENGNETYFKTLAEYEAFELKGKRLIGHAFESQLFPSLSPTEIKQTLKGSNLKFENIYDVNGYAYLSTTDNLEFKSFIKTYIANELSNGIQETLDNLVKNKIFENTADGIINKELDTKIWNSYKSDNALKASSDFFINSLISHVEYSKMFAGDVAYYKNAVDYKKRVPATYTDGLYQRLDNVNKDYVVASIESVEINSPFLPELVELLGEDLANKYKKINSADAQAWITPARWKDLVQSIGKWNAVYDSVYDKLLGKNNEPFTAEELKAVAPPLKGVYFQTVDGVPIFLKYSQAVLSPRLRKGNGLEKIYNQMIAQEVDELVTFDAIKVGSNKTTKIHNDNGQLLDNFAFKPFTIPSNGWKLQQDLPVKGMHDTEVGSQIQKNIFQGLAFNLDKMFTLDTPTKSKIVVSEKQSEAIDNVWNDNPELKEIFKNDKSSYQYYLNSVFPDSKVKDIVYHGSPNKFDSFDKSKLGSNTNPNKEFPQFNDSYLGFHFTSNPEYYRNRHEFGSKYEQNLNEYSVLLDIKNPKDIADKDSFSQNDISYIKSEDVKNNDSIIYDYLDKRDFTKDEPVDTYTNNYVVFEPGQIHILGSKEDIQQAKDFVNKQSSSGEVSGNQMVENIANVVGELSNLGYNAILKEFGVDADGTITNIDGFYQSIIAELKSTGGSPNVIDALESETSIYGVAQAKSKLENIFSSILTKRILKIKTNGGSFIQMSNFGLNKENAEKQNVIWSPRALSTTHEPQFLKDKDGNFILSENGKKIIRPGGILLSGSFIAKYIPNYRDYISKDGNTDKLFGYNNENGEFVEGVIDRKILENIIGYRIPNQGLSSNDALEIVGILPEENGDTVVAYTGITTKTGSDFD